MDASERLHRARMSLGKAVTAKDRRDVSVEVISIVANLTAAKAKFSDIETTEHEIRSILGQGFLAETKRINSTECEVPRPNKHSRHRQIEMLVTRVEEAFAMIDVKLDEDAANAIIANDPFIQALNGMDERSAARNRESLAEIFAGIDIEAVMGGASVPPPPDASGNDPVLEVRMTSMRPSEFPAGALTADETSGIRDLFDIDLSLDPSLGTAESDLERSWFKRTG